MTDGYDDMEHLHGKAAADQARQMAGIVVPFAANDNKPRKDKDGKIIKPMPPFSGVGRSPLDGA